MTLIYRSREDDQAREFEQRFPGRTVLLYDPRLEHSGSSIGNLFRALDPSERTVVDLIVIRGDSGLPARAGEDSVLASVIGDTPAYTLATAATGTDAPTLHPLPHSGDPIGAGEFGPPADVLAELRAVEVEAVLVHWSAVWHSDENVHYELPSGEHADVFVRIAEALAAAKQALRRRLLAARRALTDAELAAARSAVVAAVVAGLTADDDVVAAYEPLRTEPGSTALLQALVDAGRRVLVPVTLPDRDLDWVGWSPAGPGAPLGRDAVGRARLVLVPALAVGRGDGARLGRGGGSYDRALVRTGGRAVALLHEGEWLDAVPAEAHDRPVTGAVLPSGWRCVPGSDDVREATTRTRR